MQVEQGVSLLAGLITSRDGREKRGFLRLNKTISDGGITVDFWFIKVHTSN